MQIGSRPTGFTVMPVTGAKRKAILAYKLPQDLIHYKVSEMPETSPRRLHVFVPTLIWWNYAKSFNLLPIGVI